MDHCFWQVYVHLVWGTKNRSNILRGRLEVVAHKAMRDVVRELEMVPICVNSAWDHTHLLVSWNPSVSIEEAVEGVKEGAVEAWDDVRGTETGDAPVLEWQTGWSAFSVSPGNVDEVKRYVVNQKSLHSRGRTIDRFESFKGGCDE